MIAYEATLSYKVIYIYSIPNKSHEGFLKIGDTTIESGASPDQLPANHEALKQAAIKRINQQNKTAMTPYDLLYVELADRTVTVPSGYTRTVTFRDKDVHDVLDNSGYLCRKFEESGKKSEWYQVNLQTAINAIQAVKQGRHVLSEGERCSDVPSAPAIVLRDEQRAAIAKTISVFKKQDKMLWDCKMRFGKTLTTCQLAKEMKVQKTIIVTHRPVVVDGWRKDFHLIFGDCNDYVFQTKVKKVGDELTFDDSIDAENTAALRNLAAAGTSFFYFASVQDLRGSKCVGGSFPKNEAVFDMDWDFIVYDEAHEGTQTELGQAVQSRLETSSLGKKPKILHLSGTPYNIMGQFEDNLYSWDYVQEQRRKKEWAEQHPDAHNPYADLPELRILTFDIRDSMPTSYRFESEDTAFNFREFFRVWTGDSKTDFCPIPAGASVGDFVHEADVNAFLDLITANSADNQYPFSCKEYRDMFRHTFWIVPGVKEAKALSKLLHNHPVFSYFGIANVAGEGDEEQPYDNALKLVQEVIQTHDYSITISCGKLTAGVTVPEWTAVMMLTGGATVTAASYMQTIFRVQSAGSINGKQKERCYVFDFAPDRALTVLSEVHNLKQKGKRQDAESQQALGEFLNFCPVIAIHGTGMTEYDVPKMMRQIKRLTVAKAIKSGFDDESVYKSDTGIVMNEEDTGLLKQLGEILTGQKAAKQPTKVKVNSQGLTEEQYEQAEKIRNKPKPKLTPEEKELLEKLRKQKKNRENVIALLRNISIRLPMLIYGADKELTEEIRMKDFVTMVDDESWAEFMPKGISKALFNKLLKYYDEDVVMGAGLRIRRMAKAADELLPTQRVQRIAEIFNHFRSPDKETVLTPWRVVNLHMSDMLGGYCFYDEGFAQPDGLLDEPRLVDRGDVTADLFLNPEVKILEMNSKSGLYPLYVAYSLYRIRLTVPEHQMSFQEAQQLWRKTLEENIFVLCKTTMAKSITKRTLAGYTDARVNAVYLTKLLDRMKDPKRLANKLRNPDTWGKEGEKMKFDAIVGNPPYQQDDKGNRNSSTPVYQHFVKLAKECSPNYISMITPSRWFAGGKGLDEFRANMLSDTHIKELKDYVDSTSCFQGVNIAGGVNYFLWDSEYDGLCNVTSVRGDSVISLDRKLNEYDIFIRNNQSVRLIQTLYNSNEKKLSEEVGTQNTFGIRTYVQGTDVPSDINDIVLARSQNSNQLVFVYINRDIVAKNQDLIAKYKVVIGRSVPRNGEVGVDPSMGYRAITTVHIFAPNTVFTDTYLLLASFDTLKEAKNFASYMTLKLPRFLLHETYTSMSISKDNFRFVPYLDYTQKWTDEMLYERYQCTADEIQMIDSMMRPLEYVVHE
jgi:hypothetical protein